MVLGGGLPLGTSASATPSGPAGPRLRRDSGKDSCTYETAPSSAGSAGATGPGGRYRKGGAAPLRGYESRIRGAHRAAQCRQVDAPEPAGGREDGDRLSAPADDAQPDHPGPEPAPGPDRLH